MTEDGRKKGVGVEINEWGRKRDNGWY